MNLKNTTLAPMKRLFLILFVVSSSMSVNAQDWDREKQDPHASEIWAEVPKVTPGKGTQPPSDAIILFDGKNLNNWEAQDGTSATWTVKDGYMMVKPKTKGIRSKQSFGDVQLHIEWKSPSKEDCEGPDGQNRGNSGIFLMGLYEIQVLDSYSTKTYSNGQAAGIYKQYAPLVNATLPPEEWDVYDIIFMAPVYGENGQLRKAATVTIIHNGVLVQNHVSLWGPTEYKGLPNYKAHASKLPIMLQDHGNPVKFRNIWVREL